MPFESQREPVAATRGNAIPPELDLLGMSSDQLRTWASATGEPPYRGAQIYHALYAERRLDFAAMTNLPAPLRARLAAEARIGLPTIQRRYHSADGSVRYLLALSGDTRIEAVFMPSPRLSSRANQGKERCISSPSESRSGALRTPAPRDDSAENARQTICISTQAGCAVDCRFCLTAQLGLIRNLTAGEMAGQVLVALEDNRESLAPRTNIVLMGQGEPLLNFDAVIAAVRIFLDPNGMKLAARHVTLSTSGIVPGIERLAREKVRPKLAISLNASTDEQRDAIMPVNRKYPLEALLDACRGYPLRPWEKLTFEYVLLGGFNDSAGDARRVARLISGLRAKVNLIPWNPGELPYRAPDPDRIEEFRRVLAEKGVPVFVRYSRGRDVNAACGQLALIETSAAGS